MSAIRNIDGPKDFILEIRGSNWNCRRTVPNAILGEIFKYLMQYQPIFKTLLESCKPSNLLYRPLIALIAMKFNLTPLALPLLVLWEVVLNLKWCMDRRRYRPY